MRPIVLGYVRVRARLFHTYLTRISCCGCSGLFHEDRLQAIGLYVSTPSAGHARLGLALVVLGYVRLRRCVAASHWVVVDLITLG